MANQKEIWFFFNIMQAGSGGAEGHAPIAAVAGERPRFPGEIDFWLSREGALDELADTIIQQWLSWAETTKAKGRRRVAEHQLAEIGTMASVLIRYHAKHGIAPSARVADALDHALGVINPLTGDYLPATSVLKALGGPPVEKMAEFLLAAKLDGEADAAGIRMTLERLEKLTGVARSTLRRWRDEATYQRRRAFVAALPAIAADVYRSPRRSGDETPED